MFAGLIGAALQALWTIVVVAVVIFTVLVFRKITRFAIHAVRMRVGPAHEVRCRMRLLRNDRHMLRQVVRRYRDHGYLRVDYAAEVLLGVILHTIPIVVVAAVGAVLFDAAPLMWMAGLTVIAVSAGCLLGLRSVLSDERQLRDSAEQHRLADTYNSLAESEPLFPWPVGPEANVDNDASAPGTDYMDAAARWEPEDPAWVPLWANPYEEDGS